MPEIPVAVGRTALAALGDLGVSRLEQLAEFSAKDLLAVHGIGPKAVRILAEEMAEHGLALRDRAEGSR